MLSMEEVNKVLLTDVMVMDDHAASLLYIHEVIFANELVTNHEALAVLKGKC